jgi:glycosyltransferase involved in cell wall biosynthesis
MQILRLISSMAPEGGGPAQGIRNSVPALARLGVHNEVVCLDDPGKAESWSDPFPVHALGQGSGPWHYSKALIPWLVEQLPRFDAVINHGLWQYPSYAIRQACAMLKKQGKEIPYYVMPHGMLDPWFQKAPERRLKAWRNSLYWALLERRTVADAAGLLFTCAEELRLARQTFPSSYQPRNELNVGYGISDVPELPKEERQERMEALGYTGSGVNTLLFLSRIHPKKGLLELLGAYVRMHGQGCSLPKLLVAGPGMETPYGRQAAELAATLPPGTVQFLGMLKGRDKWAAFQTCEAFILPSHQENFGIAVVEALASGKPVIITDQVNIWSEVIDAGAGLCSSDDIQGLIDALSIWIRTPLKKRLEMGTAASRLHREQFSVNGHAGQLLTSLKDSLNGKNIDFSAVRR